MISLLLWRIRCRLAFEWLVAGLNPHGCARKRRPDPGWTGRRVGW